MIMKNKDEDIQSIELYFENKLTQEEAMVIEQRLENDTDFKKLFKNYKQAIESVNLFGRQQLKDKLQQIKFNRFSKPVRFILFRIAAIFLGILFISLPVYYIAFHKSNSERIYDNYFIPYNDIVTEKGIASNTQQLLSSVMFDYNNKKYKEANIVFSKISQTNIANDTILFYYGISLLADKKPVQSISIFKKLKEDKTSIFNDYGMSDWYLALAYIKVKDNPNAIKILNDLVNKNNDYSGKAKEILEKL
jgi:hypothetical protein